MFNGGLDKIRQYVLLKYNGNIRLLWSHGCNRIIYQIQIKLSYERSVTKGQML
jgi:hypothetical protein